MSILKRATYRAKIRYESNSVEKTLLVEAESMENALGICREYFKNTSAEILELIRYTDILVTEPKFTTTKTTSYGNKQS